MKNFYFYNEDQIVIHTANYTSTM